MSTKTDVYPVSRGELQHMSAVIETAMAAIRTLEAERDSARDVSDRLEAENMRLRNAIDRFRAAAVYYVTRTDKTAVHIEFDDIAALVAAMTDEPRQ